jgi:hypothetical protein
MRRSRPRYSLFFAVLDGAAELAPLALEEAAGFSEAELPSPDFAPSDFPAPSAEAFIGPGFFVA